MISPSRGQKLYAAGSVRQPYDRESVIVSQYVLIVASNLSAQSCSSEQNRDEVFYNNKR
jgi:hypothetical protein